MQWYEWAFLIMGVILVICYLGLLLILVGVKLGKFTNDVDEDMRRMRR